MIYIDEFLYRGRAPDDAEPSAWALTLACVTKDALGSFARSTKQMNMEEATAAGWALPKIIESINASLAVEVDASRRKVAELEERLKASADEGRQLKRQLAEVNARS